MVLVVMVVVVDGVDGVDVGMVRIEATIFLAQVMAGVSLNKVKVSHQSYST